MTPPAAADLVRASVCAARRSMAAMRDGKGDDYVAFRVGPLSERRATAWLRRFGARRWRSAGVRSLRCAVGMALWRHDRATPASCTLRVWMRAADVQMYDPAQPTGGDDDRGDDDDCAATMAPPLAWFNDGATVSSLLEAIARVRR